MNPATEAARTVARQKLAALLPGQTGINFADEVADSILCAIEAHLREQIAREIEKSEFTRGPASGSNHYVGGYTDGLHDAAAVARGKPTT